MLTIGLVTGTSWSATSLVVSDTIYVDTGGQDANDGTSPTYLGGTEGPVRSCARAVELAASGDVISIEAGDYTWENMDFNVEGLSYVVRLDGSYSVAQFNNFTLDAPDVEIGVEGAGTFAFGSIVELKSGSATLGTNKVALPAGVSITVREGTVSGNFVFGGSLHLVYLGSGDYVAGGELPANSSLNGGTLTVNFANEAKLSLANPLVVGSSVIVSGISTIDGRLRMTHDGTVTGPGMIGELEIAGGDITIGGALAVGTMEIGSSTANRVDLGSNRLEIYEDFTRLGGEFISDAPGAEMAFVGDKDVVFAAGPNFLLDRMAIEKSSASVTIADDIDLQSDLSVVSGATLNLGARAVSVVEPTTIITNEGTIISSEATGVLFFTRSDAMIRGSGVYGNMTVSTASGNPIRLGSDVVFAGILSLNNGGVDVVDYDLSPVGNDALIVVNVKGVSPTIIMSGAGGFNAHMDLYDLEYRGVIGTTFNAGPEFSKLFRDVRIRATNGKIVAPDPGAAFEIKRDIDVTGSGAELIMPGTRDVNLGGALRIVSAAKVISSPTGRTFRFLGNDMTHEIVGVLNLDHAVAINGTEVVFVGSVSDLVPARFYADGITLAADSRAMINALQTIESDVIVQSGAHLTLGLAHEQLLRGHVTSNSGIIVLASNVRGLTGLTLNSAQGGSMDFAAYDLFVNDGAIFGAKGYAYSATSGALAVDGAHSLGTNGEALPGLKIYRDVQLTSNTAVSKSFWQKASGATIDLNDKNLTLKGAAWFAGGEVVSGDGILFATNLPITLGGDAEVTHLHVLGSTAVHRSETGHVLTVNDVLMTDAALTQKFDLTNADVRLTGTGRAFDYKGGELAAGSGFLEFGGSAAQEWYLERSTSIPNLAIDNAAGVILVSEGAEANDVRVTKALKLLKGAFDTDYEEGQVLTMAKDAWITRWGGYLAVNDQAADLVFEDFISLRYGDDGPMYTGSIVSSYELPAAVNRLEVLDPLTLNRAVSILERLTVGDPMSATIHGSARVETGATIEMYDNGILNTDVVSTSGPYRLIYRDWDIADPSGEWPTHADILSLTIDQADANKDDSPDNVSLDMNRFVRDVILKSGGFDLSGHEFRASGDFTFTGGRLLNTSATSRLVFDGAEDQHLQLPGTYKVPAQIDIEMRKPEGTAVTFEGGDLDFAGRAFDGSRASLTDGQLLVLNGGALRTGDGLKVILEHSGTAAEGYLQPKENSVVRGTIMKQVVNHLDLSNPIHAGRVQFPLGAVSGDRAVDYNRCIDFIFSTNPLGGQSFITDVTIGHYDAAPEGIAGLPVDFGDVLITRPSGFYWLVSANPRLSPTTEYSIEATGAGLVGFVPDEHEALRLIRRTDGDIEKNNWLAIGKTYENFMVDTGEQIVPTVVATGAMSAYSPAPTRISYGFTSTLKVVKALEDFYNQFVSSTNHLLVVGGDPFMIELGRVFQGGEGTRTFLAESSNEEAIIAEIVNQSFLNVSAIAQGAATITVKAIDELGNVNKDVLSISTTAVGTESEELPSEFALDGNYPNPFNPHTTVLFDLPQAAQVSLEVLDVIGRRVLRVAERPMEAGTGRVVLVDASDLASGVYVYRIVARTANDVTWVGSSTMTLLR